MSSFAYTARRGGPELSTGVIDAVDENEAVARLRKMGFFLLTIEKQQSEGGFSAWRLGKRITREDVVIFTSQLSCLLKAGLPLVSALKALREQMASHPLAEVIEQIGRMVSESDTFSESLARFPRFFPRTYVAAVRAGEEGGMLVEVLARLAQSLKAENEVRGRIRAALAYPIFLCVLGAATLCALLVFVIPRFTKLFVTMGEQLPLPTRVLLVFSGFMEKYWPILLVAAAAVFVGAVFAMRKEAVRLVADRGLLHVPLIGSIVKRMEIARCAQTLSELLRSGVPILNSLRIARGVMKNRLYAEALESIRSDVAKGTPIATSMKDRPYFSPLVVNMVAVGEQSGQLAEMLAEVADIYEKECERAIQAFTSILGPGLIVVLGGVIGFVITAILLPVFQASTLAG